jgi:hypothetical protein
VLDTYCLFGCWTDSRDFTDSLSWSVIHSRSPEHL